MLFLDYLTDVTLQTWLIFLLIFLVAYNYVSKEPWRRLPPGPPRLPLLGSIPFLGTGDIRPALTKMARKYGEVFTIYLGSRRVIILSGYGAVKEAFSTQGHQFADRPDLFPINEVMKGHGIGFASGAIWREQRRYILRVLHDFGTGHSVLEDGILSEVAYFIDDLSRQTNSPMCPTSLLQRSAANVICAITFGKRFEYDDPKLLEYVGIVSESAETIGNRGVLSLFPVLRFLPGDIFRFKQLIRNRNYLDRMFMEKISDHKRTFSPDRQPCDVIDAYLKTMAEEKGKPDTTFTDRQLIRVIDDFFNAGTETTSTTLSWAIVYAVLEPEIQAKVHAEIDDVIKHDEIPRMQMRSQLPYTEAYISEVQRISDIVPLGLAHQAHEDTTFRGYLILKGTMIIPNMSSVHHDPEIWPDPYKFDPTRFLDDDGKYIKRRELIPFSIGKRVCLGEGLARMELFLYVVSMMQQFRFSCAPGYPKPSTEGHLCLTHVPKPFHVVVEKRRD